MVDCPVIGSSFYVTLREPALASKKALRLCLLVRFKDLAIYVEVFLLVRLPPPFRFELML